MTAPTFAVAVTLTAPGGSPRTVTGDLVEWSTIGPERSSALESLSLPSATIVLDNTLGAYDPVLVADTRPGAAMTISVDTGDTVFGGIVTRATLGVGPGQESVVQVDASQPSVRDTVALDGAFPLTTIADLFVRAGDVFFNAVYDDNEPQVGGGTVDPGTSFWSIATDIAEALGATVYYNPDTLGWVYVSRSRRSGDAYASWAATVGDGPVTTEETDYQAPLEIETSDDLVFNVVTVEPSLGVTTIPATMTTPASVATYGPRALSRQAPLNALALVDVAIELGRRYSAAYTYPPEITVPHAEMLPVADLLPLLRATYPHYGLVRVIYRPPYASASPRTAFFFVDGRRLSGEADGSIEMTLRLSPTIRDGDALFNDVAAFGGYDIGRYT